MNPSVDGKATTVVEKYDTEDGGRMQSMTGHGSSAHSAVYNRRSSIGIHRIDSNASIFDGEDPELVDIALKNIRKTDRNNDGQLDIDEVGLAILGAVKDARKASTKEKRLKRVIGGLSSFLAVFATIFLIVQGVGLSKSIDEAKITSINEDAYGHAHLQDSGGSDLSTRAFGDKIIVESKIDLYSGRILHCTSVGNVAAMTNDATNGVDAIIVATTPDGLPAQGIALSGDFSDSTDALHFGNDKVRVLMTSSACDTASADPEGGYDGEAEAANAQEEDVFGRQLALRRSVAVASARASSSAAVLAKNRQMYSMAMTALHEGRHLTGGVSSLQVELPPWDEDKCLSMPADNEAMIKTSLDNIACPAMRFLIKKALQDGLFDLCGYGVDSYMVDAVSMKQLLTDGIGSFVGLQRHKIMTNDADLSVFERAFNGAIDGQATGVLKHSNTKGCINIEDYQFNSDEALLPATSSNINMDSSCSGVRQRWKLTASPTGGSIRIHHRRSAGYCLGLNNAGTGVELTSCADAEEKAQWKLDSAGRINVWGGADCLDVDVSSNILVRACDSDATSQVWVPPPIFNAAHIENNFDHSASSGIIGTATDATDDNNSFNRDRYNEFLGLLCNCDPISLPAETTFTEVDFGRAVNHFGSAISNPTVMASTGVGAFSWGILTFEWSNTFVAFKKDGVFPLATFKALFLPDGDLIEEGLLDATTIGTTFVPNIERDELGVDEVHRLSETFTAMDIKISADVKLAMDQAVANCNCALSPSCGACGFHGLFTDLCGVGYARCLASKNS